MSRGTPAEDLRPFAETGMLIAHFASLWPNRTAIQSPRGSRSFGALNGRANQLVRALARRGVRPGDGVALICGNTPEFVEVFAAIFRAGLRLTPINWRLSAAEASYIVHDCEARALITHADHAALAQASIGDRQRARLAIRGAITGFEEYEIALGAEAATDIPEPMLGQAMLYTSGTTGRPKGVHRLRAIPIAPQWSGTIEDYHPDTDVNLCAGPAYHGGPLGYDIVRPLLSGVPIVLMERFDAEAVLHAIETQRITHLHLVATMFVRLLRLPDDVRARYDLSSLRVVFHGAAPTPRHVKEAMIAWWGPVFCEYYAATESAAVPQVRITTSEWLAKPGSVGRLPADGSIRIGDDEARPLPPETVGHVWFRDDPAFSFEYFRDPQKTREAFADGFFRVGDMGRVDDDNFLFLTGRSSECIISGGVNIYPQEIDDALSQHPDVSLACTIGAPDPEWGEQVRGVVVLRPGAEASAATEAAIREFIRARLAGYKVPRRIDFVDALPVSDAGKVHRSEVRERYWSGQAAKI